MKKTKTQKAYAVWSKLGFHQAFSFKANAEAFIKAGKKQGCDYFIIPCEITFNFPIGN